MPYDIHLKESSEEHEALLTYDMDFSDPPSELREEIWDWLEENIPSVRDIYDEANNPFGVTLRFESKANAALFILRWMGA